MDVVERGKIVGIVNPLRGLTSVLFRDTNKSLKPCRDMETSIQMNISQGHKTIRLETSKRLRFVKMEIWV